MQMYTTQAQNTEQFPQFEFVQQQNLFVNAPMVQPLAFPSQTIVPSLGLTQTLVIPQWPQTFVHPLAIPSVPMTTTVQVFNEVTKELEPSSQSTLLVDATTNMLVPLPGWSFVSLETFESLTPTPSETEEVVEAVYDAEVSQFLKDPAPVEKEPEKVEETKKVEEPKAEEENKAKKYPHRSKQILIEEVHAEVKEIYEAKGLYASDDEVLRGHDTVRIHVKTYDGLKKIQEALTEVEEHPEVVLYKIATPISMKNKFQKKGFIVYLKLEDRSQVPAVQSIFAKYPQYKKCDVALAKEEQKPIEEPKPIFEMDNENFGLDFSPPRMIQHCSTSSLAA